MDNNYRVGEVSYTKYGTKATIIEYKNNKNVLVEFDDDFKYRYKTSYMNFKNGKLTNPYEPRHKNGIGYVGVGKYNSKNSKKIYSKWKAIIQRCSCENYKNDVNKSIASYDGCSIYKEWECFQNFAEWYENNLYDTDEELCVDKDILVHRNKVYSPENCLLVPKRINLLFIKELARRGDLPIGVQNHKQHNGYVAYISKKNKTEYIGFYDKKEQAFLAYKKEKEKYIKQIADEYKNIIPKHIYDALYNYKVLITD